MGFARRPTVEAEVVLATARSAGPSPLRRIDRLERSGRSSRWRPAFGGLGVDRAVGQSRRRSPSALRGMPIMIRRRSTARLVELDGTPNKARLGGNATVAVSMAAAARGRRGAWRSRCGATRRGRNAASTHADDPDFRRRRACGRRVDIQDILIVPIGASTFDEAMSIAVRIYDAGGTHHGRAGRLRGVADEGGWWPEFASNSDALDTLLSSQSNARSSGPASMRHRHRRRCVAIASAERVTVRC